MIVASAFTIGIACENGNGNCFLHPVAGLDMIPVQCTNVITSCMQLYNRTGRLEIAWFDKQFWKFLCCCLHVDVDIESSPLTITCPPDCEIGECIVSIAMHV